MASIFKPEFFGLHKTIFPTERGEIKWIIKTIVVFSNGTSVHTSKQFKFIINIVIGDSKIITVRIKNSTKFLAMVKFLYDASQISRYRSRRDFTIGYGGVS